MHRFWTSVVEPLLSALRPETIVEVGAASGSHTQLLVRWAEEYGAVLHVVDPGPAFDVEQMERDHPDAFVMHRATSLNALPAITNPGAVLVDGDHNWYTVFHELQLLDQNCKQWPVTLHHDVDWPYGRRDMYYEPSTIPVEYHQPFRRSGIVYGQSALAAGEVNDGLLNARHEGGPRNGVLTAIEDFMDSTQRDLELFAAPGPSGLGLLIDGATLESKPAVCEVVKQVHDTTFAVAISPRYASRYFDATALRRYVVAIFDVTNLTEEQAGHLAGEVAVSGEASEYHPDVEASNTIEVATDMDLDSVVRAISERAKNQ